jgi:hypothetical protein
MHSNCMDHPVSAALATETAQHERSKTSKPFIFNETTPTKPLISARLLEPGAPQNATSPNYKKYQTNPSTAQNKQLWDGKQRS